MHLPAAAAASLPDRSRGVVDALVGEEADQQISHLLGTDEPVEVLPTATRCLGHAIGKVYGMATRKVTLSIDQTAWALAEAAAARAGISPSAWLSTAARREAIRLGAGTDWGDSEAEALSQDADLAKAEEDLHAAG
jgi:hypothetical protein